MQQLEATDSSQRIDLLAKLVKVIYRWGFYEVYALSILEMLCTTDLRSEHVLRASA